ncbi:hypothetical protein J3E72DRAFT_896 [Bipolaris maydis]|uniref:uncharacterized protein n=1 Tax=Cochliobolus heterostrophus TaxID=5016 RepID=UPI0024DB98DB|nr:hypothetical protein J3E73DRAFT_40956 [Bipolaris maydis]KAJ6202439.1 hypothetical protein J3E72DRAFT_896 [Bipolaris maydis]KAJ6208832.1 hypothetical protein PSV09DRAFT_2041473 [Bipolaris maydis]KAJ6270728.1 hypothetical protein PSV08DRAFT_42326 [Bipolaris maydis]KAJ6276439.1 hypothetical protein J3E71DRAFT_40074 [Bipolaris maydis]
MGIGQAECLFAVLLCGTCIVHASIALVPRLDLDIPFPSGFCFVHRPRRAGAEVPLPQSRGQDEQEEVGGTRWRCMGKSLISRPHGRVGSWLVGCGGLDQPQEGFSLRLYRSICVSC